MDITEIRLHDLAPSISSEYIKKLTSQYGEVKSITIDTWINSFPGILNGATVFVSYDLLVTGTCKMGKKMKPKLHVRDNIVDFLLRSEKFLQSTEFPDENQIRFRLEKLEAKWGEFEEIQSEIEASEDHEENFEQHRQVRADFEEKYFEVRAGLVGKLPREAPQNSQPNVSIAAPVTSSGSVHTYVRLPQINLPEFDGNFENWLAFHDTFRALIDASPELSNIQKFHYLRASLKGDALKLVDSYPMSDANYRVAWDGLVSRFSNSYILKKRHLNALFEYPRISKESAVRIHDLIDNFERNTKILDQLGEKTSGWGAMLTHLMVSKLDDATQKHWEEYASGEQEPAFPVLVDFLKKQTRILDALSVDQQSSNSSKPIQSTTFKFRPAKVSVNSATEYTGQNCMICNEQHSLTWCPNFADLPVDERLQFTNSKRLCRFPGSGATPSTDQAIPIAAPSTSSDASNVSGLSSNPVSSVSSNVAFRAASSHVFLLTVVLKIKDKWGRAHNARGLLDSGSQANLMSENLCQLLKLPRSNKRVEISGIGRSRRQTAHEVSTIISSCTRDYSMPMDFLVLGQVTEDQPSVSLPLANWKPPHDMELADPNFFVSGPIDLVLGSQFFYDFHLLDGGRLQMRKLNNTLPVFVNTVFGWEEEDCEAHFQSTVSRDVEGRYVVQYPKRIGFHDMMGESKNTAIKRFHLLERRLDRDPNLRKNYNEFLQQYVDLGHMQLVGPVDNLDVEKRTVCYLPHHPVFKETSSTTKLRVVFDESAKTSTNYSLNDALMTGPVIQDDLLDLMLRFRKHAVALVADVEKMYRQIRIHPDDAALQRIVWRFDSSEPIQVYELLTVTYGLSPSSFLATRVLKQLATDGASINEGAALAIAEDFYMDDFLSGARTVDEARQLRQKVQEILTRGGLHLRKWNSNRPESLEDLPLEAIDGASKLHFEKEQKIKTLGVIWETVSDKLCFEVNIKSSEQWTKRMIFSAIAQLYDPLGLVSPVVAWAKIHMQELWSACVDWDDPVPEDVYARWEVFYAQLPALSTFKNFVLHSSGPSFILVYQQRCGWKEFRAGSGQIQQSHYIG
ncbi:uncharacterized protein LOC131688053 [Topomyia yanbarensis]|uniref:uncharacterized protein LOC131688053 n=1 Tax=Topomyia yanbarensis TaxID=2498891 RepID=UPI00273C6B98|nr:uncharacterized protein LOC131688053 [Topomyia yanbarensis]